MAQPRPAVSVPTPPRRPRPERPSTAPDLAVGLTRACAITAPDRLTCWGAGAPPQHKAMPGVVQVEVDSEHVCTLLGSGEVRCWGSQGDHARGFQTAEVALPERASALTLGGTTPACSPKTRACAAGERTLPANAGMARC